MQIHFLKTWPAEHDELGAGVKTFEVRSNTDRSFAVGDCLELRRWDPAQQSYVSEIGEAWDKHSGHRAHTHKRTVTHIMHGGRFGLPPDICVMSIAPYEDDDDAF